MKRKRKLAEIEQSQTEDEPLQTKPSPDVVKEQADDNLSQQEEVQQAVVEQEQQEEEKEERPIKQHRTHQNHHNNNQHQNHQHQRHQKQRYFETGQQSGQELEHSNFNNHKQKKFRNPVYSRVSVDPSRTYSVPDSRESWGPNVKGKKFRKEKGKKKRCPNAGVRIDGSVKSVRLDV